MIPRPKNLTISILLILLFTFLLPSLSPARTPQEIAQVALGSTVLVTITDDNGQSSFGSGFVIGTGQIATNHHVIEGIASGTVRVVGETTSSPINSLLAIDPGRDLAIIQATGVTASSLALGDSDAVQIGQTVYAAGNPRGLTGTFSEGIISAIRPEGINLVAGKVLQMTAAISPGSSGGPVLNADGAVIGIAVGQVVDGQNLNFAIPVNYLKTLITKTTQTISIPDANLRTVLATALGKTASAAITAAEMTTLTGLDARNADISDLTGLEHATNLTWITLGSSQVGDIWVNSNAVTDISPLAGLTNLTWLVLTRNSVSDISGLSGLTNLTTLGLGSNRITDISVVARLVNLRELYLWDNSISDISALATLTHLTDLDLQGNSISDITVLSDLTKLEWLTLEGNPIRDTSPVCAVLSHNPELELDIEVTCNFYSLFMQDFNNDGTVNISDLFFLFTILFAITSDGDANGDGTTDFLDLAVIVATINEVTTNAAPVVNITYPAPLTTVRGWLDMAYAADDGSLAFREGITLLKRFLEAMCPEKTELFANYPNPFNPETWIPYHLAHPADVTLTIYDTAGVLVRQLDLGHQQVGYYTDKKQAAYWDGRNQLGETVGSGVYFYQLQADDFSATRKLVILK